MNAKYQIRANAALTKKIKKLKIKSKNEKISQVVDISSIFRINQSYT